MPARGARRFPSRAPGRAASAPGRRGTCAYLAGPGAPRRAAGPRDDEQVPSWAQWQESGDGGEEDLPPMRAREPRDRGASRALRAAARRRRRWLIMGGGAAVLAGAIVAVVLLTGGHQAPAGNDAGALVTTFQHGELGAGRQTGRRFAPLQVRRSQQHMFDIRFGTGCFRFFGFLVRGTGQRCQGERSACDNNQFASIHSG